jgi:restriction system protein
MTLPPTGNHRATIDGSAFEQLVLDLLAEAGRELPGFRIEHRETVATPDGAYQIDVTARFRQLGVDFFVLVECKDHTRAVEREDVQVLADRKRAAGAQKAILFATNGFQKGAIEYAKVHGIALVRVLEGSLMDETRSAHQPGQRPTPPPWANIQPFAGQRIDSDGTNIRVWLVERGRPDALRDYLLSS